MYHLGICVSVSTLHYSWMLFGFFGKALLETLLRAKVKDCMDVVDADYSPVQFRGQSVLVG